MKKKYRIILFFVLGFSYSTELFAQNIETMLNNIGSVFSTKEESLYDEAENYLLSINKDSVEANINYELLYHIDMALLYSAKYHDWDKSCQEQEKVLAKLEPYKHIAEYRDYYKSSLMTYGYHLMNGEQIDRAEEVFSKVIINNLCSDDDINLYNAYNMLANIYERRNDSILSSDCHRKCQEFLINRYIKDNPNKSFYLDYYKTLTPVLSYFERKEETNKEIYITNLCSLGALLHKVDYGEYWESFQIFRKALGLALKNNQKRCKGLAECYPYLQDIYIKYVPEPYKSNMVEELVPLMIDYYSGVLTPDDIYMSISSSYAANQFYEKSIEYEEKALCYLGDKADKEKLKPIYKGLINDYLGIQTDSTNHEALIYLQKLESIISESDMEYYDWSLEIEGCILRYLYQNEAAIRKFSSNLSYFKKKYGKESDQYISTLNQLALSYPYDSDNMFRYLTRAKEAISTSNSVKDMTVQAVSVNLARYYISKGNHSEAIKELNIAESIQKNIFGQVMPATQELINECAQK